jgi:hypothetical protein
MRKLILAIILSLFLMGCASQRVGSADPCADFKNITFDAMEDNNTGLCNAINDSSCFDSCIHKVVLYRTKDESGCALMKDDSSESRCYQELAKIKGAHLCDMISAEFEVPSANYYCMELDAALPKELSEGKILCDTAEWKDTCVISVAYAKKDSAVCSRISSDKMKDMCILDSDRDAAYFGESTLDCSLLSLPESQEFCNSAKEEEAGFVASLVSINIEETCGNKLCEEMETSLRCPQDCRIGSGGCVVEDYFVSGYKSVRCCEDLTEARYFEAKGGICKKIDEMGPWACIKPNNGICGPGENKCNSPEDCG